MSNLTESSDEFTVEPRIILDLIKRQAGSLSKALAELISNSLDGGAQRIDVTVAEDGGGFVVADDGEGFKDADEVRLYYKRFGFEHSNDQYASRRQVGRFGLGRAQAWAWASTVYVTNHMEIDTNVQERGLRYLLREHDRVLHKGCKVVGTLYENADRATINATLRELRTGFRFMEIPVYLNGTRISTPASNAKWTIEDDDAYYLFDSSQHLQVYNRGIYVCDQGAWRYGTGGMIVSKQALELDMSRTQLLPKVCPVWKRIELKVKALHRKAAVSSSSALTDPQREAIITGVLDGDISLDDVWTRPLLVNITGRGVSPRDLCASQRFTVAPDFEKNLGDVLHRDGEVLVLAQKSADWWVGRRGHRGDENIAKALLATIKGLVRDAYRAEGCDRVTPVAFKELASQYRGEQRTVADADLSAKARFVLEVTRRVQNYLPAVDGLPKSNRALRGGVSDSADGWTDGRSFVAINEKKLELAFHCEHGLRSLFSLLIHEYLHSESSAGEHAHDVSFYKAFHDLTIDQRLAEESFVNAWCGRALAFATTKAAKVRGGPGWVKTKRGVVRADSDEGGASAAAEAPSAGCALN